jgi:ArsR family metal-binding transcriptional regulator
MDHADRKLRSGSVYATLRTGGGTLCCPGRLVEDISAVLPYLNASLREAVYHQQAKALTWKKGGHNIAFHAFEIATSNVDDRDGAEKELKRLIDLVNHTWERRTEITPDTTTRQRPTPMALFKLLPRTNCKQCGEPTCYSFALKLAASKKKLADCPPLNDHQYANNKLRLGEIWTALD